jgi:hypothetical protein
VAPRAGGVQKKKNGAVSWTDDSTAAARAALAAPHACIVYPLLSCLQLPTRVLYTPSSLAYSSPRVYCIPPPLLLTAPHACIVYPLLSWSGGGGLASSCWGRTRERGEKLQHRDACRRSRGRGGGGGGRARAEHLQLAPQPLARRRHLDATHAALLASPCGTVRNFPTHGQLSAAQGNLTSCLNFDFAILNLFEPSAP